MKVSKRIVWLTAISVSVWAVACSDSGDDVNDDSAGTGGSSPGDGDGDGDGDGTGGSQGTGGSATGGTPATGGAGGDGGMGGEEAMGGFGGDPNAFSLADACAARCTTIVSVGCTDNTDQTACEEACVGDAEPGCEDEYDDQVACETTLLAEDYMCISFGPFNSVGYSSSGYTKCETEFEAYQTCADL